MIPCGEWGRLLIRGKMNGFQVSFLSIWMDTEVLLTNTGNPGRDGNLWKMIYFILFYFLKENCSKSAFPFNCH